jgi:hypothetical protein
MLTKVERWYRRKQFQLYGFTDYPAPPPQPPVPDDPRLRPVDVVDRIDELVNESLSQHLS